MAFTFTLEAALQRRRRQEQDAQVALAGAVAARRDAAAWLEAMERELAHVERGAPPPGAALDGEGRITTLYYLDRARHAAEQQRGVVTWCDGEVARARGSLLQAAHRRIALERLRERRYEEYQRELQQRLESQLDELVTLRYGNRVGSAGDRPAQPDGAPARAERPDLVPPLLNQPSQEAGHAH